MIHGIRMLFYATLLALSLCSCNNNKTGTDATTTGTVPDTDGEAALSADSLAANIQVLSSDAFMGRKPFSEGERKTVGFLETAFRQVGLEPGNNGSYFQEVPMVQISTKAGPSMKVESPGGSFDLKGYDDYVIWTDKTDPVATLDATDVVFAGYGVVAPEYNWNDYAGLDVKGKVVLVIVNDPGFHAADTSLFKGKTMTYYGRWTYKFEEAARQGAKGCLIIHDTAGASYPFTVIQNNWNGSRLRLDPRGKTEQNCEVIGWVTSPAAARLLSAAGKDPSILQTADRRGFHGTDLGLKLSAGITVTTKYNKSINVIGKITGSKHPDEYIIYTAHWDHLGIGKPDETGDSIYNGALDNASGTASLFELARAFHAMKQPPGRTIVFLSVTAEEQGLQGSAWYAANPVFPLDKTLADINMDGVNYFGKTEDYVVIGRGQNELEDYLAEAAATQGRRITFEAKPEAGLYYRSDHFNFAKVGVPSLFGENGSRVIGRDSLYGEKKQAEFNEKHYHRPSDQYDPAWDLGGAIADLQLFFVLGKRLASTDHWPQWKPGSEFKAIRDKK